MTVQIISREEKVFRNRMEAGRLMAERLGEMVGANALVLAIPRGGVVVGGSIADELNCDLDVVVVRKLGAPSNPELAIGALMEGAEEPYLNESIIRDLGVGAKYIEEETERQRREAERQAKMYRKGRPKIPVEGRTVILTDDGIATGATMVSSIRGVKARKAGRIIVALPVGPRENVDQIAMMTDDLICFSTPPFFAAVGQFYEDFSQTTDEEVVQILSRFAAVRD
jgi:putative phosphoribosyl transferase